ncbi:MAG TPA: hypothetical protein VFS43_05550 [Polyangiaceae bacterium]|nr:hypothetical protein [Polyangiaceae bacterium]
MVTQLLRFFGMRAVERRLFGKSRMSTGWSRYGRLGVPVGGLPMVAYLAWTNRQRIASAYRWARGRANQRGGVSTTVGVSA